MTLIEKIINFMKAIKNAYRSEENQVSLQKMSEKEKLIEILNNTKIQCYTFGDLFYEYLIEEIADQLLENGIIVPPVKIGQTVYYIFDGFIEPCTVEVIFLSDYEDKDGNCTYKADIHFDRADCPYTEAEIYFTDIGKTIFLTKQEAEKALKGGAEE